MRVFLFILGVTIFLAGCQSEKILIIEKTPVIPANPIITQSQEGAFEVTTATRTNGCILVLNRYTKAKPNMQGYWAQNVFVGNHQLFRIEHSTSPKEQVLVFERMTDIGVIPTDRNLDGKYDMFGVLSIKDQKLIDVLLVTEDGWLRHSTKEEFGARQKIIEDNRRSLEEVDRTIQNALDNTSSK